MSEPFDPTARSVRVSVRVVGPRDSHALWCAIDTGSTRTILPATLLRALGCDLSRPADWARINTATGAARAPLVRLPAVAALGRVRTDLLVAAHDFPAGTTTRAVLGLDFFRGLVLTLDFARGLVRLAPPRPWWRFWG